MKLKEQRRFFKKSNRVLRRARRLYVRLCLKNIEKYGNPIIDLMAKRMHEAGLYWEEAPMRAIRHSINGHHFALTKHRMRFTSFSPWHEWCSQLAIDPYSGYYNHKKRVVILPVIEKATPKNGL